MYGCMHGANVNDLSLIKFVTDQYQCSYLIPKYTKIISFAGFRTFQNLNHAFFWFFLCNTNPVINILYSPIHKYIGCRLNGNF